MWYHFLSHQHCNCQSFTSDYQRFSYSFLLYEQTDPMAPVRFLITFTSLLLSQHQLLHFIEIFYWPFSSCGPFNLQTSQLYTKKSQNNLLPLPSSSNSALLKKYTELTLFVNQSDMWITSLHSNLILVLILIDRQCPSQLILQLRSCFLFLFLIIIPMGWTDILILQFYSQFIPVCSGLLSRTFQ